MSNTFVLCLPIDHIIWPYNGADGDCEVCDAEYTFRRIGGRIQCVILSARIYNFSGDGVRTDRYHRKSKNYRDGLCYRFSNVCYDATYAMYCRSGTSPLGIVHYVNPAFFECWRTNPGGECGYPQLVPIDQLI